MSRPELPPGTKLFIVTPNNPTIRPGTCCSHWRDKYESRSLSTHTELTLDQHIMLMQVYGANGDQCWNVWVGTPSNGCDCSAVLFDPYDKR